jgi:hypothetical protein
MPSLACSHENIASDPLGPLPSSGRRSGTVACSRDSRHAPSNACVAFARDSREKTTAWMARRRGAVRESHRRKCCTMTSSTGAAEAGSGRLPSVEGECGEARAGVEDRSSDAEEPAGAKVGSTDDDGEAGEGDGGQADSSTMPSSAQAAGSRKGRCRRSHTPSRNSKVDVSDSADS